MVDGKNKSGHNASPGQRDRFIEAAFKAKLAQVARQELTGDVPEPTTNGSDE